MLIDKTILDQLEELQMDGEPDIIVGVMQSFLMTSQRYMTAMEECIKTQNLLGVAKAAHALKSSAQSCGALEFANLCLEIEHLKNNQDLNSGYQLYDTLLAMYRNLCKEMSQIIQNRL